MTQILWKHYFRNLQWNTRMCICSFSLCNWHSGWVMRSEIKSHARICGYIYLLLVNTKGVAFRMLRTLAKLCSWPSLAGSSPPAEPENGQYPLPLDPLPPIMGRRTFSSWSGHTWDRRTTLEDKRIACYLTHTVKYLHIWYHEPDNVSHNKIWPLFMAWEICELCFPTKSNTLSKEDTS